MSDQVRVGVIGTSWWADELYLPALSQYEKADVVAVCGRNRERAQAIADKYGVPQVFTDYRQMIDSKTCDAVIISTPDDTHYEMVMAVLDAGLHVLCEKPVALNADHAGEMYRKAEAAGVKHMVMFSFRWFPNFRVIKQRVDSGYVGKLYHADFRYMAGYGRSPDYAWRFDGDRAHGILGDLGSHLINLACWYLGDVVSVSAQLASFVQHVTAEGQPVTPTNDLATLMLGFASGAQATIQVSGVAHLGERQMQQTTLLYGDAGTLETRFNFGGSGFRVHGLRHDEAEFSEHPIPAEMLKGATAENPLGIFREQPIGPRQFIDSILDDQPIEPGLDEGYKVQQVIDAALKSHETGQRVLIS